MTQSKTTAAKTTAAKTTAAKTTAAKTTAAETTAADAAVVDAAATTIVLTQRVGASPDVVFDFLTDPQKMLRWMGTEVDIDPQPGGKFWLNVTGSDIAVGSYVEVDRPNRVVFTWGWDGSEEVPPASSTVAITLTADDDHTIVELEHSGLPTGQDTEHTKGWTYYLPRLGAVSEGKNPD